MIRFFRKIRQSLLDSGKLRKYLLYALGEIMLVVLGILIALQINNWNEKRKELDVEEKLLLELKENLQTNIRELQEDLIIEMKSIESINLVIEHLEHQRPFHDSLRFHFRSAIYSPDVILGTSAYESIKSRGFDIIQSDQLRQSIIGLFDGTYGKLIAETVRLEDLFWPEAVLPAIHKHLRFTYQNNEMLTPTNYKALVEDKEFINMLAHRRHFRELAYELKTRSIAATQEVISEIEEELRQH